MKEWEKELYIYRLTPAPPKETDLQKYISNYLAHKEDKYISWFLHYYERTLNEKSMAIVQDYAMYGHFLDIKQAYVKVVSILGNISNQRVSKTDIEVNELSQQISAALINASGEKYNLTAYGYLLTQLSYYFRCKIVHGSRPVLLFAHADNKDLHDLKVINDLLEEFIDSNLHAWFDAKYIADIIIPKAQRIKLS